jgi:putative nucleotidyltransferase with HDIG domain
MAWIVSRLLYFTNMRNYGIRRDLQKQRAQLRERVVEKAQQLRQYEESIIKDIALSMNKLLELHDPYTGGHSKHVAELSQQLAVELGLSSRDTRAAYWAGMIHDIGKLLIPVDVLQKEGPLSEGEYEKVKEHSILGFEALRESGTLEDIARYVLHHHERWDGRGYPHGLKKDEIPLLSQILAVADAWDAMTSQRAYREPFSNRAAVEELRRNRGSQFSPAVVDVFIELEPFATG